MTEYAFKMQMRWTAAGVTQRKDARRRRSLAKAKAHREGFVVDDVDFSFDGSVYDIKWIIVIDKNTEAQQRPPRKTLHCSFMVRDLCRAHRWHPPGHLAGVIGQSRWF